MFVCSNSEYEDGMEELAPVSVLDVVMALQRQGAIGQFKNSRYMCINLLLCVGQDITTSTHKPSCELQTTSSTLQVGVP